MWVSKPPPGTLIDIAHPLAQGMLGAWPLNEGGGERCNDATGAGNPATFNTITGADWRGTVWGPGLLTDANQEWLQIAEPLCSRPTDAVTMAVGFTLTGAYPTYRILAGKERSSAPYYIYSILSGGAAGAPYGVINGAVTAATTGVGTGAHVALLTWRLGDYVRLYLDNQATASAAVHSSVLGYAGTYPLTFGHSSWQASTHIGGIIVFGFLWDRQFSAGDAANFIANPWQVFWDRRRYWFVGASAAAYAFSGLLTGGGFQAGKRRSLATGGQL